MTHPDGPPLGLHLNQAARVVGQQFDRALGEAGGSLPVWLVLLSLASRPATQRALAAIVGVSEATLSHHLNSMERDGLVTRTRNASNRRVHDVEATEAGRALFRRLRDAAIAFDARLNAGLSQDDRARFSALLRQVVGNVSDAPQPAPPWAGVGPTALAASEQPRGRHGDGKH